MPSTATRPRPGAPTFLALGCVGAFVSGPAFAEAVGSSSAKPVGKDHGQVQSYDDILVTGARDDRGAKDVAKPIDTPRSVVVLPEKIIKEAGATTLADALRTVPGLTFGAAEGGNPLGDRPFIRGFDSQGSTYVDGVRDTAAQSREVFAVDSVQVVRGSDSTLGGRGSASPDCSRSTGSATPPWCRGCPRSRATWSCPTPPWARPSPPCRWARC